MKHKAQLSFGCSMIEGRPCVERFLMRDSDITFSSERGLLQAIRCAMHKRAEECKRFFGARVPVTVYFHSDRVSELAKCGSFITGCN